MSPNLPTLQALLSRVEGGTGEDRELLLAQWVSFVHPDWRFDANDGAGARCFERESGRVRHVPWRDIPPLLTSLDAAVALCERVRPGEGARMLHWALLRVSSTASIAEIARAVCACLLRAEIAKREAATPPKEDTQ
jgi:hypothetical protein